MGTPPPASMPLFELVLFKVIPKNLFFEPVNLAFLYRVLRPDGSPASQADGEGCRILQ
jgi:hypothetical protein